MEDCIKVNGMCKIILWGNFMYAENDEIGHSYYIGILMDKGNFTGKMEKDM